MVSIAMVAPSHSPESIRFHNGFTELTGAYSDGRVFVIKKGILCIFFSPNDNKNKQKWVCMGLNDDGLDECNLFRSQTVAYPSAYEIERYQTRLVNFKKEGMGRAIYDGEHSNEVLVTQWKNGMKNGRGFIYDKNTKRVTRRMEFEDNMVIHEELIDVDNATFGIVDANDGSHWEGDIVNGEACGQGCIYNRENELIYCGSYIDGAREGYGVSYYTGTNPPKTEYDGLWCRNMRHGEGKMLNRLGEFVREGLYLEDAAVETTVTITCFSDIDDLSTLTESIIIADNTLGEITELNLYECRRLRTLQIGDDCCKNVTLFSLSHLRDLTSVVIGKNSFTLQKAPRIPENVDTLIATEARSFEISFCPVLKSITIGSGSFFEYKTCTLRSSIDY